eukprot:1190593-Prorocentrum_minimum.AAC.2
MHGSVADHLPVTPEGTRRTRTRRYPNPPEPTRKYLNPVTPEVGTSTEEVPEPKVPDGTRTHPKQVPKPEGTRRYPKVPEPTRSRYPNLKVPEGTHATQSRYPNPKVSVTPEAGTRTRRYPKVPVPPKVGTQTRRAEGASYYCEQVGHADRRGLRLRPDGALPGGPADVQLHLSSLGGAFLRSRRVQSLYSPAAPACSGPGAPPAGPGAPPAGTGAPPAGTGSCARANQGHRGERAVAVERREEVRAGGKRVRCGWGARRLRQPRRGGRARGQQRRHPRSVFGFFRPRSHLPCIYKKP